MKARFTFKTPDAVDDVLSDIHDEDEQDTMKNLANKFFKYGEYVTVELDTETGTAKVLSA
jgi:hypothetical protein